MVTNIDIYMRSFWSIWVQEHVQEAPFLHEYSMCVCVCNNGDELLCVGRDNYVI